MTTTNAGKGHGSGWSPELLTVLGTVLGTVLAVGVALGALLFTGLDQVREDMRAMEGRLREDIRDLRDDVGDLRDRVSRLESRLAEGEVSRTSLRGISARWSSPGQLSRRAASRASNASTASAALDAPVTTARTCSQIGISTARRRASLATCALVSTPSTT